MKGQYCHCIIYIKYLCVLILEIIFFLLFMLAASASVTVGNAMRGVNIVVTSSRYESFQSLYSKVLKYLHI